MLLMLLVEGAIPKAVRLLLNRAASITLDLAVMTSPFFSQRMPVRGTLYYFTQLLSHPHFRTPHPLRVVDPRSHIHDDDAARLERLANDAPNRRNCINGLHALARAHLGI